MAAILVVTIGVVTTQWHGSRGKDWLLIHDRCTTFYYSISYDSGAIDMM